METLYSNPNVPLIENPINLDREIQSIQLTLALLPWLDKSFGRARTGKDDNKSFPEVYKGGGEYHNCLPNDHLKSQSFIRVRNDSGRPLNYEATEGYTNKYTYPLDIIFWFNLQRIDPGKRYRFDEELKKEVTDVLKELTQLKLTRIYEAPEDVFQGYSFDFVNPNIFRYPYGGFRFECDLFFTEDC